MIDRLRGCSAPCLEVKTTENSPPPGHDPYPRSKVVGTQALEVPRTRLNWLLWELPSGPASWEIKGLELSWSSSGSRKTYLSKKMQSVAAVVLQTRKQTGEVKTFSCAWQSTQMKTPWLHLMAEPPTPSAPNPALPLDLLLCQSSISLILKASWS